MLPLVGFANPNPIKGKYDKSKTIKKEFTVNADALLKISNKYGNLDVITWNENRVVIEVKITVSGNSEEKVSSRLDKIDVKFESSRSEVYAKTVIEKSSGWFSSNNNMSYQIDYKVKMPITNEANLTNDYGTISLNELKGKAKINCDYGKILIGSLFHEDNSINIDYTSNSVIEFMNTGTINADYSKIRVEKAKSIKLNADYTTTVIENIEDLNFSCDYGNIEVGNGNSINGNGDYLTMRFGKVYKKFILEADYGGLRINKLMKGFETVKINSDYTGIKIGLDDAINFNFKVNLSYGGLNLDTDNVNYVKKVVKSSSKYYEGYVKSENSGSTVEISSDYGSVKMYNN
jgi:hypothetical protein